MQAVSEFLNHFKVNYLEAFEEGKKHFKLSFSKKENRLDLFKAARFPLNESYTDFNWISRVKHFSAAVAFSIPILNAIMVLACKKFFKRPETVQFNDIGQLLTQNILNRLDDESSKKAMRVCKGFFNVISRPQHHLKQRGIALSNLQHLIENGGQFIEFPIIDGIEKYNSFMICFSVNVKGEIENFGKKASESKHHAILHIKNSIPIDEINIVTESSDNDIKTIFNIMKEEFLNMANKAHLLAHKKHVMPQNHFQGWVKVLFNPKFYPELKKVTWETTALSENIPSV